MRAVVTGSRVLLVRHARTVLNAANLLRGQLDPELDEVGCVEAQALAEALSEWMPGRIVTSPLRRARQTATAVGDRVGVPVIVEPGLIDRNYGRWAGRPAAEVISRFGSLDAAPGVETVQAMRYRAEITLDQQLSYLGPRSVVLVSHDVVIRELLAMLNPELGPADWIGQRTACFNELVHDTGEWRVLQVDQKPFAAVVAP